jgi:hypothetical protein
MDPDIQPSTSELDDGSPATPRADPSANPDLPAAPAAAAPAPTAEPDDAEQAKSPPEPWTTERFFATIAERLGPQYAVVRDTSFCWLTPFGDRHAAHARQGHYGLRRLPELIPGLEPHPPPGGWPAILFSGTDDQLTYNGFFPGSGTNIISGGVWRTWPIGHLAIPVRRETNLDAAFVHELVHAVLSGSGIPRWIQEGIATSVETAMGAKRSPLSDLHAWRETLAYWRGRDPALFWSGRAFSDPDSSAHAYRLAQVLGRHWTRSAERLHRMRALGRQGWQDQDAALRAIIGADRAAMLAAVIEPRPPQGMLARLLHHLFVGDQV